MSYLRLQYCVCQAPLPSMVSITGKHVEEPRHELSGLVQDPNPPLIVTDGVDFSDRTERRHSWAWRLANILFFFFNWCLTCMYVCMRNRVTNSCELPGGFWDSNLGPLEVQPIILLAAKSSFQPRDCSLKTILACPQPSQPGGKYGNLYDSKDGVFQHLGYRKQETYGGVPTTRSSG